MIRARVRSGMENARDKGRQIGQRNITEVARVGDLSRTTVYKYLSLLEA